MRSREPIKLCESKHCDYTTKPIKPCLQIAIDSHIMRA